MGKLKRFFTDPCIRFGYLSKLGLLNWLGDEEYLKIEYCLNTGKKLNLCAPKTFNEKLQWLKLYDRKDIYTVMVDKAKAKEYVAEIIGDKYIIPTLGVYDCFDDIGFDTLPNKFVIKCTHDSGGLVICKDKAKFDKEAARKQINKYLKRRYYYIHREWPYKNVQPKIIVEKYMEDKSSRDTKDYKFFCFNGSPEIILVCTDRFANTGMKETWFDTDWNMLPITEGGHDVDYTIQRPSRLAEMKKVSRLLTKGLPFLRVDFYEIDGKTYFGEMTFSPAAGYEKFKPEIWDKKLGDLIDLSLVKK